MGITRITSSDSNKGSSLTMVEEAAQNGFGPKDFSAAFNGSTTAERHGASSNRRPVDPAVAVRKERVGDSDSRRVPSVPNTVLVENVVSGVSSAISMCSRGVPPAWHARAGVAVNMNLVRRDSRTGEESKVIDCNSELGHNKKSKAGIHVEYTRMARDGVLRFPSDEMKMFDEDIELDHSDKTKTGIHVEYTRMAKDGVMRLPRYIVPFKKRPLPEKGPVLEQQGNNASSDVDADVLTKRRVRDKLTKLNHPVRSQAKTDLITKQRIKDEMDRLNHPTRNQADTDFITKQHIKNEMSSMNRPVSSQVDTDLITKQQIKDEMSRLNHPVRSQVDIALIAKQKIKDEMSRMNHPVRSQVDTDFITKQRIREEMDRLNQPIRSQVDTDLITKQQIKNEMSRMNRPVRSQVDTDLITKQRIQEEMDRLNPPVRSQTDTDLITKQQIKDEMDMLNHPRGIATLDGDMISKQRLRDDLGRLNYQGMGRGRDGSDIINKNWIRREMDRLINPKNQSVELVQEQGHAFAPVDAATLSKQRISAEFTQMENINQRFSQTRYPRTGSTPLQEDGIDFNDSTKQSILAEYGLMEMLVHPQEEPRVMSSENHLALEMEVLHSHSQEQEAFPFSVPRPLSSSLCSRPGAYPVQGPLDRGDHAYGGMNPSLRNSMNSYNAREEALERSIPVWDESWDESHRIVEAEIVPDSPCERCELFMDEPPHPGATHWQGGRARDEVIEATIMPDGGSSRKRQLRYYVLPCMLCLAVVGAISTFIFLGSRSGSQSSTAITASIANVTETVSTITYNPPVLYLPFQDDLPKAVLNPIEDPDTPFYQANKWMVNDPYLDQYTPQRQRQRFYMALWYYTFNGDKWTHTDNWLSYFHSECSWWSNKEPEHNRYDSDRPVCDEGSNLLKFNLAANNLEGPHPFVSDFIPSIRSYNMANNKIYGDIPASVKLPELDVFIMSNNAFEGTTIDDGGFVAVTMRIIKTDGNQLFGYHAPLWDFLPLLEVLDNTGNRYDGTISGSLGGLTRVKELRNGQNLFEGPIPSELGLLTTLEAMDFGGNFDMNGAIPEELGFLTALTFLNVSNTAITGEIPPALCARERDNKMEIVADCDQVICCSSVSDLFN